MSTSSRLGEFEAAAVPHINNLYNAACRTLGCWIEAEDVVQDTYMQAWKSFHRFETGTNIRAWLFKIMFRVISRHRRKTYRSVTLCEDEEFVFDQHIYEPPLPQELRDEDILAALERVPEYFRSVILLADVQELTYRETACALGIPIGTVMSKLNRGRKILRASLAGVAST